MLAALVGLQVPLPRVGEEKRLLLAPLEFKGFYRCVARYGYMDVIDQVRAWGDRRHRQGGTCLSTD